MQAHRQLDARARQGSLSESLLPAFANEQALSVRPALRSREGRPSDRSHFCFAAGMRVRRRRRPALLILLNRDTVVHRCCIAWTEEQSIDRSASHLQFVTLCGRVESRATGLL